MLRRLAHRWFGRRSPPAASTPAPVAARRVERRAEPAAAPAVPVGLGARRPLVGPGGKLAGFDFHVGTGMLARLRRREDESTAIAATANLLGAMRLCIAQKKLALAEVPAAWIAGASAAPGAIVLGMHLTLLPDALFDDPAALAALLQSLRAAGARVGWPADVRTTTASPDYIVLPRPPSDDRAAWQRAIDATAACWRGVPLVLPELPDVDALEALLKPPVQLAGCVVGQPTGAARAGAMPPQAQRLLRLLNRIVRDDDTALLVTDIKADAALALRLLEFLNSAGAMPGRTLDSIDQAVMVLGRDALYRWVAQMLVRLAPPRTAGEALQALALARARLLEKLGHARGDANPGGLYLLGLASVLPQLLQCPLEEAIESLQLPAPAVEALREGRGPWHPYLALALALERDAMAETEALAQAFGGLPAVLGHAARAWLPG